MRPVDPSIIALTRELHRAKPKLTYKKIAIELERRGHVNGRGTRFSPDSIKEILRIGKAKRAPAGRRQRRSAGVRSEV